MGVSPDTQKYPRSILALSFSWENDQSQIGGYNKKKLRIGATSPVARCGNRHQISPIIELPSNRHTTAT
jgi:hypothetical protein